MTEKKYIEHIFQEKLASHEVNPPEIVWTNIEEKLLEKKKKRRIIPFWWKFSGVAALFVVGFFVYNTVNNQNYSIINYKNQDVENENSIVNSKTNSSKKEPNSQADLNNLNKKNQNVKTENSIVNSKTNTSKTERNSQLDLNNNNFKTIQNTTNSLVNNKKLNNKKIKNKKNIQNFKTKTSIEYVNSSNDVLITNKTQQEKVLLHNDKNTNNLSNQLNPNDNVVEKKNNFLNTDKIAMNQNEIVVKKGDDNKKNDSTVVASVGPNAMEELLNEKEKKKTKEQKLNRWQVTPYLAPVFFGSFNNGSPLDASLAENTKTYNTNMSYGMNVNYSINKKFNVRTGVNVLSFSYNTQDIVFYQDVNAKMMKNISPNTKGEFIQIKPLTNVNSELDRVTNERFDGILNQQMGYIEVPMEFTYKLMDKKFGIEFIGGLSTLFLNKNDIFLKADETIIKIGTASNLNNLNFSSNIGLGIKYSIFKNFDTRIEPIFKYQFNTFSQDSGNFKPYIFGVYTGLSYKF